MTDETPSPVTDDAPSATPSSVADAATSTQPVTPAGSSSLAPVPAPAASGQGASLGADRPEMIVGAAFAAGFAVAMLLRRLVR